MQQHLQQSFGSKYDHFFIDDTAFVFSVTGDTATLFKEIAHLRSAVVNVSP